MVCWDRCIICQKNCSENLTSCSEKGKTTLLQAVNIREDDVYRRLHDECESFNNITAEKLNYHKSCYRTYTSKMNLAKYEQEPHSSANPCSIIPSLSTVKTRSQTNFPTNWSVCIFCNKLSYKKDRKLKRIKTRERFNNLLKAANRQSDFEMEGVLSANDF